MIPSIRPSGHAGSHHPPGSKPSANKLGPPAHAHPNAMVHANAPAVTTHPTTLYEKADKSTTNQSVHLPLTRTSLANPAHPRPRNNKHTLLESAGKGVRISLSSNGRTWRPPTASRCAIRAKGKKGRAKKWTLVAS